MNVLIWFGKIVTLLAWLLMFFNLLVPFAGQISLILNILLLITLIMHGVQTLIFHSMFRQLMALKAKDYMQVMLFGVFGLLDYRQRLLAR